MKHDVNNLVIATLTPVFPLMKLRGTDKLSREGGDIDYLVPSGQAVNSCMLVAEAAIAQGWFLAGFRNIGYLAQIVLLRPAPSGNDQVIKLDFFDGLNWYNVGEDIIGEYLFEMLFFDPTAKDNLAGVASFFQKALITGRQSNRDWARVAATGVDVERLQKISRQIGLPISQLSFEAKELNNRDKWRLRAASCGVVSAWGGLFWFLAVSVAHLRQKFRIGTSVDLLLGVSGLDGSGKSTLVGKFVASLKSAGWDEIKLVHFLHNWIPMPHQIIQRKKTQNNYTRPYAEPPVSSRLNGNLRLAYYIVAFTIAKLSLMLVDRRGKLVILDRSFFDFASDLTRAKIPEQQLPLWLIRMLIPGGKLFFLDADPKTVVSRKDELTLEKARTLQASYRQISTIVGATHLNGEGAPEEVYIDFLRYVSAEYQQRIRALVSLP